VSSPEKQSIRAANEHLFAKNREMRPLCFGPALPMKVEWYNKPYYVRWIRIQIGSKTKRRTFGVLPLVLRARKRAFSAPRI